MGRKKAVQRAAKLDALRQAARVGFDALDRGEFKEFKDADDLERYIKKITDPIIRKSSKQCATSTARHSPRKRGIQ
jgi:antitoxin ParD1/3/4